MGRSKKRGGGSSKKKKHGSGSGKGLKLFDFHGSKKPKFVENDDLTLYKYGRDGDSTTRYRVGYRDSNDRGYSQYISKEKAQKLMDNPEVTIKEMPPMAKRGKKK
jgi:hypothetical protein